MPKTELYGTESCPNTQEMREWLEWHGREFVEYDVESDSEALERMRDATGGQRTVPVLVEDGKAVQIGWQGRGCIAGMAPSR
ncbi:MAG: Uxx-star family glutaredoxin-like (seleno)protein [Bryobacteraceae bacterium]